MNVADMAQMLDEEETEEDVAAATGLDLARRMSAAIHESEHAGGLSSASVEVCCEGTFLVTLFLLPHVSPVRDETSYTRLDQHGVRSTD